jgi:chitinase
MRTYLRGLFVFFLLLSFGWRASSQVPTFQRATHNGAITVVGRDPAQGGTTLIPTLVVPITLEFESRMVFGKSVSLEATRDVQLVAQSPIFVPVRFGDGKAEQYADAMLRATFPAAGDWHTKLGRPVITKTVTVKVPVGFGYVLTSKKTQQSIGIADIRYVQEQVFKQVPRADGSLVVVVTHNVAYYAEGDATICCSFGTHGTDTATGNSFILASYLEQAPEIVQERDVQPLTEQLGQFLNDPAHNPLLPEQSEKKPGNVFPAWMRPDAAQPADQGRCAGTAVSTPYFLLEPTDVNRKNNFPFSPAFIAKAVGRDYHLQNVALLPWYLGVGGDSGTKFSFPDAQALPEPAKACPPRDHRFGTGQAAPPKPTVAAMPNNKKPNGHALIGYWSGYGSAGSIFPLREVSPQWDIIIVAFSTPDKNAPEGTMQFHTPAGLDTAQFKNDIAYLKSQGKKIMISLGGGGQHFTLADPQRVPNFVSSVTRIVNEYGFDGIDVDFESPSLAVAPGDTDYQHPTTPSIVNLIRALRQLHEHFGPKFAISLVPEGTQIPAGYPSYGGQFGSYLPIAYAIRDILTFIDVQDYNTPPLQGLDGEIYQAGTVDYHAAMTELLLHGFAVGGDVKFPFPGMRADQVAVGFLTGETTPEVVREAMQYLITGKAPAGVSYRLRKPGGYPEMIGAMFWTIDGDRRGNYCFSNVIGPQLHSYPATR